MAESAVHLVDQVLPEKPIRQWVISFPFAIRLCLAVRPKIMTKALGIANSSISAFYRKKAKLPKGHKGKTGSVTLIQRFGGSLNLNVHFHQLYIDGVYEVGSANEEPKFHACNAPTIQELSKVLNTIIKKLTRYLEKENIIVKDEEHFQLPISEEDAFSRLQASSVSYRFATGPSKGKKALVLRSVPETDHTEVKGLVVKESGFSLHAGVECQSHEREKLERLCRYVTRPAIAEERLSMSARGKVIYKLKRPWADGTTAIKLTPLELIERLASLVPRPRVHLTRFHGVLASHAKLRSQVVPKKLQPTGSGDPEPEARSDKEPTSKARRISWKRLLKRVFAIDIEQCSRCGGKVKVIASIEDPKVIKKILEHLNLPSTPQRPEEPARGPPESDEQLTFALE